MLNYGKRNCFRIDTNKTYIASTTSTVESADFYDNFPRRSPLLKSEEKPSRNQAPAWLRKKNR